MDIPINPIMLTTPDSYQLSALSKTAKLEFLEQTKDYKGKNREFINYVRKATEKHLEQDLVLTEKCIKRLEDFDKIRQTDYKKIIPLVNLQKKV